MAQVKGRPEIPLYVLAGLALIVALVLLLTHNPVPSYVWAVALAGATGGAGITQAGGSNPEAAAVQSALQQVANAAETRFRNLEAAVFSPAPPAAPAAGDVPPPAPPLESPPLAAPAVP